MAQAAFPVIYLTGAPATGKSTLARLLSEKYPAVKVFAYSKELRRVVGERLGISLAEDDVRRQSANVVTSQDVESLDQQLIQRVREERSVRPFLIDSHAVTKERYGYRVTAFSTEMLRALDPDLIVCLYTSPQVTIRRIEGDPMGRPQVSEFEAQMHTLTQAQLAVQYGVILGKPAYLVDSDRPQSELVAHVAERAGL